MISANISAKRTLRLRQAGAIATKCAEDIVKSLRSGRFQERGNVSGDSVVYVSIRRRIKSIPGPADVQANDRIYRCDGYEAFLHLV